jgi:hypothetical protein
MMASNKQDQRNRITSSNNSKNLHNYFQVQRNLLFKLNSASTIPRLTTSLGKFKGTSLTVSFSWSNWMRIFTWIAGSNHSVLASLIRGEALVNPLRVYILKYSTPIYWESSICSSDITVD